MSIQRKVFLKLRNNTSNQFLKKILVGIVGDGGCLMKIYSEGC
jgi:hypothetical protein